MPKGSRTAAAVALMSGLVLAGPAVGCEAALRGENVHRADGTTYAVAWRTDPSLLSVSEFFTIEVVTCSKTEAPLPAELRIDAVMPEHKHGMNYRPTVTSLGNGRFRAEGFLLHMPGLWEFSFDLRGAGKSEVVRERIVLR